MTTQLKRDARPAREYIVEVVGPDGIRHHLGPFRQRKEAQCWIAMNTRRDERRRTSANAAKPVLSVVV